MGKKILIMVVVLFLVGTTNAQNEKLVELCFDKQQFSFVKDDFGDVRISTSCLVAGYDSEYSLPGLPFVSVNVGIPNGVKYKGLSENFTKQLLYDNIIVASNPVPMVTDDKEKLVQNTRPVYPHAVYPVENVRYLGADEIEGNTILRFLVCPFEYNVRKKELYLINNMSLTIMLENSLSLIQEKEYMESKNMEDIMLSQIVNPNDFGSKKAIMKGFGFEYELNPRVHITEKYLIVTSKALAPNFEELARWKTRKGIKSRIVAVEDIIALYPSMDAPLAIKTYLNEQFKNDKLKYVLLGGDDTIVPIRKCYGKVIGSKKVYEERIPTDLYYACFDKCFSWDANGNDIYGELSDSISMFPSIIVTRAPVRTNDDVDVFVNKILGYEKAPSANGWDKNILMAGAKLFDPTTNMEATKSDAEYKGERIYESYIAPYWDGKRYRFYDTNTDFFNGANYNLTYSNFQTQLSKGYTFVDMISHGDFFCWAMETGSRAYFDSDVDKLKNKKYTIITTTSCLTNAFDSSYGDPCLSESFIRNPQSGVVAYLGCSRYGWDYVGVDLGASSKYDALFYQNLFSDKFVNKKFGEIVAATKSSLINQCKLGVDNSCRWVQYGLNPIGDPEMPIYTDTPKTFSNVSISFSPDKKNLIVDAGVDSCSICLMSIFDNGSANFYTLRSAQKAICKISEPTSVCITKQNYIPYETVVNNFVYTKSAITKCVVNKQNGLLTVSTQLDENVADARVVMTSVNNGIQISHVVSATNPTLTIDLAGVAKGIQTVSLFVDGNLVDSRNIVTK